MAGRQSEVIGFRRESLRREWHESRSATPTLRRVLSSTQLFAELCLGKRARFRVTQSSSHTVKEGMG
jgi:hypothetical protein